MGNISGSVRQKCHFNKLNKVEFHGEIQTRKMLSAQRLALKTLLRPLSASSSTSKAKHTLPDLPYDYNALEPIISAEIMTLHHSKHHQTYVNNYNVAEEKLADAVAKGDASTVIGLQGALKFNGGGHINHSIFWQNLCPVSESGEPSSELLAAIEKDFGSLEKLQIAACANQDPLEASTGLVPLFGIDVWEHAYYLQYKNVRPDYVKAIWQVANWADISSRFANATA